MNVDRPENGALNCIPRIRSRIFQRNFVFALSYGTGYFWNEITIYSSLKAFLRCECLVYFIKLEEC